jgi:hypothetical protein
MGISISKFIQFPREEIEALATCKIISLNRNELSTVLFLPGIPWKGGAFGCIAACMYYGNAPVTEMEFWKLKHTSTLQEYTEEARARSLGLVIDLLANPHDETRESDEVVGPEPRLE